MIHAYNTVIYAYKTGLYAAKELLLIINAGALLFMYRYLFNFHADIERLHRMSKRTD